MTGTIMRLNTLMRAKALASSHLTSFRSHPKGLEINKTRSTVLFTTSLHKSRYLGTVQTSKEAIKATQDPIKVNLTGDMVHRLIRGVTTSRKVLQTQKTRCTSMDRGKEASIDNTMTDTTSFNRKSGQ